MIINLKNKKALVGGSTRGLGKAIAMELASCGASVTLVARNQEKLMKTLSELPKNEGQEHEILVADFSVFEQYREIISGYFNNHPVDILVNNTNGPRAGSVLTKNTGDFQEAFDLLFKSVCFTTLEALKGMQARKYGRVINATSITVKEPLQNLVLSNTIRSAITSWSKSLAKEVAADGITVNNIMTGYFDTERLDEINRKQAENMHVSLEELKSRMVAEIPLKRLGDPAEYGYLVAFLASEYASYITGANIPIDGGLLRSV